MNSAKKNTLFGKQPLTLPVYLCERNLLCTAAHTAISRQFFFQKKLEKADRIRCGPTDSDQTLLKRAHKNASENSFTTRKRCADVPLCGGSTKRSKTTNPAARRSGYRLCKPYSAGHNSCVNGAPVTAKRACKKKVPLRLPPISETPETDLLHSASRVEEATQPFFERVRVKNTSEGSAENKEGHRKVVMTTIVDDLSTTNAVNGAEKYHRYSRLLAATLLTSDDLGRTETIMSDMSSFRKMKRSFSSSDLNEYVYFSGLSPEAANPNTVSSCGADLEEKTKNDPFLRHQESFFSNHGVDKEKINLCVEDVTKANNRSAFVFSVEGATNLSKHQNETYEDQEKAKKNKK